ncbi:MAG: hypothetical protein B6D61_02560 [Bacteroidetes bacterium 4484_249]|nr:MAG: hypothetical protein B6D61_02560 [Bacteroidetes bacterium 4484_249]
MEEKIAKIISVIFHPLLIPTFTTLILFNINSYISLLIPYEAKLLILAMIFITTFLFPLLFIFIMKRRGIIKSLQIETREERVYPFAITAIFYFISYQMVRQLQISEIYYLFLLGSTFLIVVALLINFYSKISIHMIGIGGLLGFLIGLSIRINTDVIILIFIVTLIAGFIGFARLKLSAHKPIQVYSGFIVGAIIMLIIFSI